MIELGSSLLIRKIYTTFGRCESSKACFTVSEIPGNHGSRDITDVTHACILHDDRVFATVIKKKIDDLLGNDLDKVDTPSRYQFYWSDMEVGFYQVLRKQFDYWQTTSSVVIFPNWRVAL